MADLLKLDDMSKFNRETTKETVILGQQIWIQFFLLITASFESSELKVL